MQTDRVPRPSSPLLEDGVDRPMLAAPPLARRCVAAEPAARLGAGAGVKAGGAAAE